jgi:uncharacterized protein with ParB-like and HNH nuclease domain
MPDNHQGIYNTYIDYQNDNPEIDIVTEDGAMHRNAGQNFSMNKQMLKDVLGRGELVVPEYQRLYSWEEEQHLELWADLNRFVEADFEHGAEDLSDVFFSSIYLAVEEDEIAYEIIDGQQRLTTIHILLRAILEEIIKIHNEEEIDDWEIEQLCEQGIKQIEAILYDPTADKIGEKPRLSLNKHDKDVFDALIRGPKAQVRYFSMERETVDGRGSVPTRISTIIEDKLEIDEGAIDYVNPDKDSFSNFVPLYDSNERLLDAYTLHRKKVQEVVEARDDPREQALALINLKNYVRRSYYVGEFIIRKANPSFRMRIFEVLNDRGVELDKIDKMRATVVNTFFDEEEEIKQSYIQKWEDIVVEFGTNSDDIDDYLSVYLSIVDDTIDEVGDASDELMNAFSTRNFETNIEPRFQNPETAMPFLEDAREYLDYYTDMIESNVEHRSLGDHEEVVEEILTRLNDLRSTQWHTLVLELYHHSDHNDEKDEFYRTLETVEKLNLRRLLAGVDARKFEGVFIEATHRFRGTHDEDALDYEGVRRFLINHLRNEAPDMFGERFADTITQQQSWSPGDAKLVLWKIANERFREERDVVDSKLIMNKVHLEHVLPQTFLDDPSDPVWLTEFFDLNDSDLDITDEVEVYIELKKKKKDEEKELQESEIRRLESIENFLTNGFVEDIGNYLLLRDKDNIRASNLPFSEKISDYYNNVEEFEAIHPNRYFTPDNPRMDESYHARLVNKTGDESEGGEIDLDPEVKGYFNSFWNYSAMQQRRVDVIMDILDYLGFDDIDDEFGLESDPKAVREQVETGTEEEFQNRLSLRSL